MYLKRCQEPLELVSIAVRDVTTPGRSFEVAVSRKRLLLFLLLLLLLLLLQSIRGLAFI